MDDFELERKLEDAGIDPTDFSFLDEDERWDALEEAGLDPEDFEDVDTEPAFDAWKALTDAGLSLAELDAMDEEDRRKALLEADLDPDDYQIDTTPLTMYFCVVKFLSNGRTFYYPCSEGDVFPGDHMIVVGNDDHNGELAKVISVGCYGLSAFPSASSLSPFLLDKVTEANMGSAEKLHKLPAGDRNAPVELGS